MAVLTLVLALIGLLWASVLLAFAAPLVARWREPVLKYPLLIIESDDWGAGPLAQADALQDLTALLLRIRDSSGRSPVMTLGVVLEVPDGARIAASGCTEYHALTLADACFDRVRAAMQAGIRAGVFAPQLHGQCHYWPPAVLAAAQSNPAVHDWLCDPVPALSEALPPPLQSRWIDGAHLPSHPLAPAQIRQAVLAEAADYQAIFGAAPQVAVATTFVWTEAVETAWAEAGVGVIITPGRRATCRDAAGQPSGVDATMLTGQRALTGQVYLVRDAYFEPALGHVPARLVEAVQTRRRQGRACLLETHRFNFLQAHAASMAALETALQAAQAACPTLRFLSSLEWARAIASRDPAWIESRWLPRLAAWRARLDEIPRFRRVARLSGLIWPLALLERLA